MHELITHIRQLNDKTRAWIAEDPKNRWACLWDEELDHWTEIGIHTPEDFDLHSLRGELWDSYKDVHGIRPRWMNVYEMSKEEVIRELDSLSEQMRIEREREEEAQRAQAQEDARIKKVIDEAMTCTPLTQKLSFG